MARSFSSRVAHDTLCESLKCHHKFRACAHIGMPIFGFHIRTLTHTHTHCALFALYLPTLSALTSAFVTIFHLGHKLHCVASVSQPATVTETEAEAETDRDRGWFAYVRVSLVSRWRLQVAYFGSGAFSAPHLRRPKCVKVWISN